MAEEMMMNKQNGFATLLASLVMVTLVTVSVFVGQKGSVLEQRSANNAFRTEEAFESAEAGLSTLVKAIQAYADANPKIKGLDDSGLKAYLQAALSGKSVSAGFKGNTLYVLGYGSGESKRTVSQRVLMTSVSSGSSGPAAMTALGNVTLKGSATATSTLSGGGVDAKSDAAGNVTENAEIFRVFYVDSNGLETSRLMTTDEYFMYYFGNLCPVALANGDSESCKAEAKNSVKNHAKGYVCEADCGSKVEDDKITTAYNSGKRFFWLESGGLDHKLNMGSELDPVLIFVMNIGSGSTAAKINANSTIYGILYVDVISGNIDCNCTASAKVVSTPLVTVSKKKYTQNNSGKLQCKSSEGCIDDYGTVIGNNKKYDVEYKNVTESRLVWGNFSGISLSGVNDNVCTPLACQVAVDEASKVCSGGSMIGSAGVCFYKVRAVTGSGDDPVQIEVIGTWEGSGTGNTVLKGAAITSGNYTGQGNVSFIDNTEALKNIIGGDLGEGFEKKDPEISFSVLEWSDLEDYEMVRNELTVIK